MKNQCVKTMLLCSSVLFILAANTALAQTEETDTALVQTEETETYEFEPLVVTWDSSSLSMRIHSTGNPSIRTYN